MSFKLLGTKIYVSFLFVALISFMLCIDKTGLCLPTFFAVLFHENGHLFAMWVCECQPKEVKLVPASIEITRGFSKKKYGEIIIALLGPCANIALFLSLYINYRLTKSELSLRWAVLNLIVALFNLLPVYGLDGGTVFVNLFTKNLKSRTKAEGVLKIITALLGILVLSLGVFLALQKNFNISVFSVGIYLCFCVAIKSS